MYEHIRATFKVENLICNIRQLRSLVCEMGSTFTCFSYSHEVGAGRTERTRKKRPVQNATGSFSSVTNSGGNAGFQQRKIAM